MTPKLGKILIVDDDEDVLFAARLLLKKYTEIVHSEKDPQSIPRRYPAGYELYQRQHQRL
jgi:hypothetical protein